MLKVATVIGSRIIELDGLFIEGESLYRIEFSSLTIRNAHFKNCEFGGSNCEETNSRSWTIEECAVSNCHIHKVSFDAPIMKNSEICIGTQQDSFLKFGNTLSSQIRVHKLGYLRVKGGKIRECFLGTYGDANDLKTFKKSSITHCSTMTKKLKRAKARLDNIREKDRDD